MITFYSRVQHWPYIKFEDHIEIIADGREEALEGVYFDLSELKWKPQFLAYTEKAKEIDNLAREQVILAMMASEEINKDFILEKILNIDGKRGFSQKLEDSIP